MVHINVAARSVTCKLVYYGPGFSGKTTNLEAIHARAPSALRALRGLRSWPQPEGAATRSDASGGEWPGASRRVLPSRRASQ